MAAEMSGTQLQAHPAHDDGSSADARGRARAQVKASRWMKRMHVVYVYAQHHGFLAFVAIPLIIALVLVAQQKRHGEDQCRQRATSCGFVGNEDAYGLGIRLGVYLQWLTACLVITVFPSEERSLIIALATFSSALTVAIFVLSFDNQCTFSIEIIVMLWITFTTELLASMTKTAMNIIEVAIQEVPSSSVSGRVMSFRVNLDDPKGMHGLYLGTNLVEHLILGYSIWFWCRLAIDQEATFVQTPCGTSVFFLARVQSERGITAVSVIMALFSTAFLFHAFVGWVFKCLFSKKTNDRILSVVMICLFPPLVIIGVVVGMMPDRWTSRFSRSVGTSEEIWRVPVAVCSLVVSVIGIELMLVWNDVSDVYSVRSTGQLIPLCVGLIGLLPLLWRLAGRLIAGEPLFPPGETVEPSSHLEVSDGDVEEGVARVSTASRSREMVENASRSRQPGVGG